MHAEPTPQQAANALNVSCVFLAKRLEVLKALTADSEELSLCD